MLFDYYYGNEAEQFTFYRIPKILFKDKMFSKLSTDAKLLYGLMLDRMGLSMKNKWVDDDNRVYIIFTVDDIMSELYCAKQKAIKLLDELDVKNGIGLIERKRQGLGKPNILYVKNFITASNFQKYENQTSGSMEIEIQEVLESNLQEYESQTSVGMNIKPQEVGKSDPNNTDINNTDINNTDYSDTEIISYPIGDEPMEKSSSDTIRWIDECKSYENLIKKNIDYDIVKAQYGAWLDEIVLIMTDVVCSRSPTIRINKQDYPTDVVRSRFLKITSEHIEYIHDSLKDNTSNVRNIRAFLITTIYNSLETIDNFYTAKVNHDLYG